MTISSRILPSAGTWLIAICGVAPGFSSAAETSYQFDGHVKTRFTGQAFPDNSLFEQLTGPNALNLESDLRLNFQADRGQWSFNTAYQLVGLYGDRIEYSRQLPEAVNFLIDRLPNDRDRLMDLTDVIYDEGRFAALHRLDRLWFGYTGEKAVFRLGRQAISWGNGFFFAPMDIVNPFDPATIDTEYKAGDDMLYAQYLRDNGHDMEVAVVVRRDPVTSAIESDEGTFAVKYHALSGDSEYEILVARSFGNPTLGIGVNRSIGGAVLRGDVVVTDTSSETTGEFVTNLSYSWTWGAKNVTGMLEYYFNGFGVRGGNYDQDSLAQNTELLRRLARGQTFSVGRHYLAGGASIELTPLWLLSPNLFANLEDGSALLQIVSQHNLGDNTTFLAALTLPIGPDGSEYGGLETNSPGRYLSVSFSVFAQLAWYF